MPDHSPQLQWRDGLVSGQVPVSTRFEDPYFSLQDGMAETRHVFLAGNDLPQRFRPGFAIAELGFGTGLNFLTTAHAWIDSGTPGRLTFTSFEAFPMTATDRKRALSAFPELAPLAARLDGKNLSQAMEFGNGICLEVIVGDARATLPNWQGQADAWYLDGFSPARNPELWGAPLLTDVGRHTAPGGTAATYTAAGFVRRGLEAAGFEVTRVPGYGRKRHMTRAVNS